MLSKQARRGQVYCGSFGSMSDSYLRELSIIGLTILAIIALFLSVSRGESRDRQPAAQSASSQSELEAHQADPIGSSPAAPGTPPIANEPKWWEGRDLEAQETMAFWTKVIAGLTLIGVIILGWTLWETRKVTKETRRIGEAQTGAYLSFVRGSYSANKNDRKFVRIHIFIENTGSSPARNITLRGQVYVSKFEDNGAPIVPLRINVQPLDIREIGAGRVSQNELIIIDQSVHRITHSIGYRNSQIVFRGDVSYRDVFEATDRTEFALSGQQQNGLLKPNDAGDWSLKMRPIHPENWDEANQELSES